jgi:hypothetical protein
MKYSESHILTSSLTRNSLTSSLDRNHSYDRTWVLTSIGAVVEMGILSTLKRLLMESRPGWAILTSMNAKISDIQHCQVSLL